MSVLESIKNIWFFIGDFLGDIMSNLLLTILFFLLVTPLSVITKISGVKLMRETHNKTTWTKRNSESSEDIFKPY